MKLYSEPTIYEEQSADSILKNKFNLNASIFVEALSRGLSSRNSITDLYPANAPGTYFYHDTVAALRELSKLYGYDALKDGGVELTANDEYAIFLCLGDRFVGNNSYMPTYQRSANTESKKQMFGLSHDNNPSGRQADMFSKELVIAYSKGREVWMLLHYLEESRDTETKEIIYTLKSELSKPRSVNEKGLIDSFDTRIIMPVISFNPMPSLDNDQNDDKYFTQDIDIDIAKG